MTCLLGEAKLVLDETPKATSPFGGLASFISFLGQIGYALQMQAHLLLANGASFPPGRTTPWLAGGGGLNAGTLPANAAGKR